LEPKFQAKVPKIYDRQTSIMNDKLVTIKTFYYDSETMLYEPRFKDAGIYYLLKDQKTVSADPIVSNAIGGIKLQVKEQDLETGKAILKEIDDNRIQSNFGKELEFKGKRYLGTLKICPKCGEEETYEEQFNFWRGWFSKQKFYCKACNTEW
jgi:hypothetical protein